MTSASNDFPGQSSDTVVVEKVGVGIAVVNGQIVDSFAFHDYLGLAQHPAVCEAAVTSFSRYGLSLCSVRPQAGSTPEHRLLELELAGFVGKEDAVLLASGAQATFAALETLVNLAIGRCISSDAVLVCYDEHVHTNSVTPARSAKTVLRDFSHNMQWSLKRALAARNIEQRIIVIYGVYSMHADMAPLVKYLEVAAETNAMVLMDDAHGIGTLGDHLGGVSDIYGVSKHPRLIITGSLSKAFGGSGGFVAGPRDFCQHLRKVSSAYLHSQSVPPCIVSGMLVSTRIMREEGLHLQDRLKHNVATARQALKALGFTIHGASGLPTLTIMIGDDALARRICAEMLRERILISALEWPSVRENQARLRIIITADHSREQITRMAECLARSAARNGLRLSPRP